MRVVYFSFMSVICTSLLTYANINKLRQIPSQASCTCIKIYTYYSGSSKMLATPNQFIRIYHNIAIASQATKFDSLSDITKFIDIKQLTALLQ